MKHGKKPTREQRAEIASKGLSPENWLVSKCEKEKMVLIHRYTGQIKELKRG